MPHRSEHAQYEIRTEDRPVTGPPEQHPPGVRDTILDLATQPGWGEARIGAYLRRRHGVAVSAAEIRRVLNGAS